MNTCKKITMQAMFAVLIMGCGAHLNAISGTITNKSSKKVKVSIASLEGWVLNSFVLDPEAGAEAYFETGSKRPIKIMFGIEGGSEHTEKMLYRSGDRVILDGPHGGVKLGRARVDQPADQSAEL